MRTIKFRGQTINGHWVYGLLCKPKTGQYKNKVFISNKAGCPMAYEVKPETVEQFTELKDKNGKEIYPTDIIKIENDNLIVYFDEGTLVYCLKNKYGIHMGSLIGNGKIKVIGNIHENPELII